MLNGFKLLFKLGIGCGCATAIGLAQAATTQLTPISNDIGNRSWQDIAGVSSTFDDKNLDGQINVGETVTFNIDMHKTFWGTHAFDAIKFWIDDASVNLFTGQGEWKYDPTGENVKWFNKQGDTYSYRPWTDGDKYFSFDYTFATAGSFNFTASVMCSRDLSDLVGYADDHPTQSDWNAWSKNTHKYKPWLQGETEKYQLSVVQQPVPEPETYAMLLVGLGLLGFTARRRKDFNA